MDDKQLEKLGEELGA